MLLGLLLGFVAGALVGIGFQQWRFYRLWRATVDEIAEDREAFFKRLEEEGEPKKKRRRRRRFPKPVAGRQADDLADSTTTDPRHSP